MNDYYHIQRFTVKYCDADFKDELKISALLAYLEEIACSSADELGFGYSYVKPKGYAFMVSNICCEFLQPISLGEKIILKTWPTPPTHVVFGREYQVYGEKEELKINASSRWCLIDMRTGKILPAKTLTNQEYSTYNKNKAIGDVRWKIPTFDIVGEPNFSIKIANSEYDHNMHVNNTRYADYCLNCFSVEELSNRKLTKFMISYVRQCKEREVLSFYRKEMEKGTFLVQGTNDKAEIVMQVLLQFEQ